MRTTFATLATLAHIAVSSPFTFPLPNGFPNPSQSALSTIQSQAGGTLPNTPAPTGLSSDTLTSFRLIAYNELFEVAYFTELLANITSNATGYALQNPQRDTVITALTAVVAQEELHALNANAVLTANGVQPIQPCEYAFPVASFESAVALAATFTDVVLGTLGDVQMLAATSQGASAAGVVQALAGIIGQEGEQNGFYRSQQGKRPSSQPFLTSSARDFAFTAVTGMTVPGTCPNSDTIALRNLPGLTVLTQNPSLNTTSLQFSAAAVPGEDGDVVLSPGCHYLAYINGANAPLVEAISDVHIDADGSTTFSAPFPVEGNLLEGLSIAAVIEGETASSAEDVAAKAVWGPGLIEVD